MDPILINFPGCILETEAVMYGGKVIGVELEVAVDLYNQAGLL